MKINEKNLCVFATSPPFDKEGFLSKRGEVNKAFQRRYFVLKGNLLFYFEKKGDKEPLGLIVVEGCTIGENDLYCFEIAFNGNRTYVLAADSQENMESWMKALTCAGYEYKKLMVAELRRQLEELENSKNKISSSVTNSFKPKPPPRRENPFDRSNLSSIPNNNNVGTMNTIITSKNVSTSDYYDHKHNGNSNRENVILPQSSIGRSEFYIETEMSRTGNNCDDSNNTNKLTSLANNSKDSCSSSSKDSCNEECLQIDDTVTNFKERHENFRQVIMKDILAYQARRELKNQPLIEL